MGYKRKLITPTILKNDSISCLPVTSKNSNFLLHEGTLLDFFGAGGQLMIFGIKFCGEFGVLHSSFSFLEALLSA
ncbi:hypothetical protein Leryth_022647 [Lithospermum erythrorhizon]|nr:hypothetical protein Leryth_021391 [Lithospermum erythrorhizon]KAG9160319.1 hypothetical protein Leryth_022647 [Lithospermum erythrorhizon]